MLGFVSRLVGERGSAPDGPDGADGPDERDGRPPTRLYEYPDCESVYLSEALENCGSCGTDVDRVATERDLGYGTPDGR